MANPSPATALNIFYALIVKDESLILTPLFYTCGSQLGLQGPLLKIILQWFKFSYINILKIKMLQNKEVHH